jgi:hypothetical protein
MGMHFPSVQVVEATLHGPLTALVLHQHTIIIKICCDNGLPALLHAAHQIAASNLKHLQAATNRKQEGSGGSGGVCKALQQCLPHACSCFLLLAYAAPTS